MRQRFKSSISLVLSVCLLFSLLPLGGCPIGTAMAAENGTLQNGELTSSTDGWTITGDYACEIKDDRLDLWDEEAGSFSISQTINNMAAGDYVAKTAAIGDEDAAKLLTLTLKNEESGDSRSVQLTTDVWDDNWAQNYVFSTQSLTVAEGDSVTISISGELDAGQWYGIKNVALEQSSAVKNAPITVRKVDGLSQDFIHGMDVSMYLSEVQSGIKYYDENGKEQNLFKILSDAGVNYIRLRLWNSPFAHDEDGNIKYVDEDGNEYKVSDIDTTKTRTQWIIEPNEDTGFQGAGYKEYFLADGTQIYRAGYGAGNCDIETVTEIGKIATYYGMKVLIDFHYSDFWADPNKQSVPREWEGMAVDEKAEALSQFTTDSLTTLRDAGVDVGMVQVGNEINNGMAGESSGEDVYTLLRAGSDAVRAFDKNILIAIHYTDPQSEDYQMGKAEALDWYKVDYDVFATSYYPFWHGTPEQLTADLKEIADTYNKKVMVAEISYAWTYEDGDGYDNVFAEGKKDLLYYYSIDLEGQATAIRDAIAAVSAIGDAGLGTFYWEPAWVPVNNITKAKDEAERQQLLEANMKAWRLYGSGWGSINAKETDPEIKDDMNGGTWDNQAFFDFDGNALASLNVYKWVYTGAEGPTKVSTVDTAEAVMDYQATPELPDKVNVNLNDGTQISVSVNWDQEQVEALKTAVYGEYTIDGQLDGFSYTNAGDGSEIKVEAGEWKTTCLVTITGKNYVTNGSFEDNNGDGSGWTVTNNNPGDSEYNAVKFEKNSANAKYGSYYCTGWAGAGEGLDFTLEQTISETLPLGYYALFAYYQGTSIPSVEDSSKLYAVLTYQDGTTKEYTAEIQIMNVWREFYQAIVKDIPITSDVVSVKVGTHFACSKDETLSPWVVVDDISLMRQGDLTPVPTDAPGTTDTPATPVTSAAPDTPATTNTPDTSDTTVTKPAKVKSLTLKNSASKVMKVSYKKVSNAVGYRITYSTSKKFTKKTTTSVTTKKTSKKIKKLKKGKTYYVKVQAYKTDSAGKKVYGDYSAVKKVKIKK